MKKTLITIILFLILASTTYAQNSLININTAGSIELQTLDGIGPVKAQAIIDYRNQNGPFETIEEIMEVSGIAEGIFADIRDFITVSNTIPTGEIILVNEAINSDTTWSSSEGVYVLESTITVSASSTLTIGPGTIIKGKNGGAGKLEIYGALIVNGNEESSVYFTSLLDDEIGGDTSLLDETPGAMKDWVGIYFKEGSIGELNNVVVRYAGYIGAGSNSGIDNEGGNIEINNSHISDNYIRGVLSHSGYVSIENTTIENHQYGVMATGGELRVVGSLIRNNSDTGVEAYGAEVLTLVSNTFTGNQKTARADAASVFSHSGNTSSDITNRGFEMAGVVEGNREWHSTDLPVIVPGSNILWISSSGNLSIVPGTIIKFGNGSRMIVEGTLEANGTEDSRIYFVSLKDDSYAGDTDNASSTPIAADWNGIEFRAGSLGNLSYSDIKHAGGFNGVVRAGIYNLGGIITLDNVNFSENYITDFYQEAGSSIITHSTFSGNTEYAIVNESEDMITATNNWWGVDTGPTHSTNATGTGQTISNSVVFDPWLRRDPELPNPVIIVPGIMATELLDSEVIGRGVIWPSFSSIALSVTDDFLDVLELNINGIPDTPKIIVGEVLTEVGGSDYWSGIISILSEELNEDDIFIFPYDWRFDLNTTTVDLKNKIDQIKILTGAEEVDIIAHSMGGLLVKNYLNNFENNSINKLVDIGSPHNGAPSAFKIIMFGDNLGISYLLNIFNLNRDRIKNISQNMPSVYQLLPSEKYFEDHPGYYVFNGINGSNRLDFEETKGYLKGEGRNAGLVDRADEFHQEIDDLDPADFGVDTYNFVGCGTPTLGQFYILGQENGKNIYNVKMINGDGTVPLKSAESIPATHTYYVRNAQHALMPSTTGVKDVIAEILTGGDIDISSYSNLALTSIGCSIPNGKMVSFHSPIDLHIYDESGNHVGPGENGDIENEISGVVYEVIDDNKFAYLPEGQNYTINGNATGPGTFDVRIQEIVNEEVSTTTIYSDISLSNNTNVSFDLGVEIPEQIYLDLDGDEVFESSFSVSTTTSGILESTGEIEFVDEDVGAVESTSSRAQFTLPASVVLGVATTSLNPTKAEQLPPKIISKQEEGFIYDSKKLETGLIVKENSYSNTAVAYKSFGYKIKNVFMALWFWIKSKF